MTTGIETGDLQPLHPQGGRSTRFVSGGDPDPGIFVKVVVREWRDTDLIALRRTFARRSSVHSGQ